MAKKRKITKKSAGKVVLGMSALNYASQIQGKAELGNNEDKKRVVVGMSGGVDSAVAAALLKQKGYEVEGIFMFFQKGLKREKIAFQDAKKTAEKLGIKLSALHLEKEFQETVVNYFLKEYATLRTPNPCAVCNPEIKFRFLFQKMSELKADYVATGHYVRLQRNVKCKDKHAYHLYQARDKEKDQSYFLYGLRKEQLAKILFPLGELKKTEVKELAKKWKLSVADKKESQDICFISEKHPDKFLRKHLPTTSGDIIDTNGVKLGTHQGLPFYTIGQRKGIKIGGAGPYYVVRKDAKNNQLLVIDDQNDPALFSKKILVRKVNWLIDHPNFPLNAKVRTRYQNHSVYAIINEIVDMRYGIDKSKKIYEVKFKDPQWAVAPGQSAVFYGKNGLVLGGGIIMEDFR